MQSVVSADWLAKNLDDVLVLDGSMTKTVEGHASTASEMIPSKPEDTVCGSIVRPPFPIPRVGDEVCIEGYLMVRVCTVVDGCVC